MTNRFISTAVSSVTESVHTPHLLPLSCFCMVTISYPLFNTGTACSILSNLAGLSHASDFLMRIRPPCRCQLELRSRALLLSSAQDKSNKRLAGCTLLDVLSTSQVSLCPLCTMPLVQWSFTYSMYIHVDNWPCATLIPPSRPRHCVRRPIPARTTLSCFQDHVQLLCIRPIVYPVPLEEL